MYVSTYRASEKRLSEDQMALAKVEKAMSTKEAERREVSTVIQWPSHDIMLSNFSGDCE